MITCTLRYRIDPHKLGEFETYARLWLPLVERFGGIHHGYFLPHEGANDIAYALFSFDSLAAYEAYRRDSADDADCAEAYAHAERTRCILSYERSFTRPLLPGEGTVAAAVGADAVPVRGDAGLPDGTTADVIDIDEGRER